MLKLHLLAASNMQTAVAAIAAVKSSARSFVAGARAVQSGDTALCADDGCGGCVPADLQRPFSVSERVGVARSFIADAQTFQSRVPYDNQRTKIAKNRASACCRRFYE